LQWCKELASALARLHAKGILHRDVKVRDLLVEPLSSSSGYLFSQRSLNN